ncbi:MAG: hypothetical protein LUH14_01090 [Clostridiaceae bacterium]|nr:hypothetical protein [Clostridiaceae bacterium]
MEKLSVLQMLQICDSLFPIGAFTLSNGLETFVYKEKLRTPEELSQYLGSYLSVLPYGDLGSMMLAYSHSSDWEYLRELDLFCAAWKAPEEVRVGSKKLCSRFLKIWEKIQDYSELSRYRQMISQGKCHGNHSIAVGLYGKAIGLEQNTAAGIYCYSILSAIVTNAVKTVPLSQADGQKLLHGYLPQIDKEVQIAAGLSMEDLGISGTEFDIEAMNHETLYSRLYMS